jgi:hypothetical protein
MKFGTSVTSLLTDVDVVTPPTDIGRIAAAPSLVELPGIEPGSYGIPSRLLRAQFAMPLLGSPDHANKSG